MKRIVLLSAVFLFALISANANEIKNERQRNNLESSRYGHMRPLTFTERGVEFYVFPNGEFDFNTHPRYRNSRNVSVNTTYGAPGTRRRHYHDYYNDYPIRIEHDHLGRVRRIGNVFINYDARGRIKRAGSVYMSYNHRSLTRIGGLRIYYNRHGRIIRVTGSIKHNMGCYFCGANNCNVNHYDAHDHYDNEWDDGYYENDDDLYYYRNENKTLKPKKR